MLAKVSTIQSKTMQPLRVYFDTSCCDTLTTVLTESALFRREEDPSVADAVIFGGDAISYVEGSELYRSHRSKSLCITESDIPTFRLPGLYAASNRSYLTRHRVETINYFISERARGNPEIQRLAGKPFEKKYLYSFTGGSNSWARKRLFRHVQSQADVLIKPTDQYNHWDQGTNDEERRAHQRLWYAEMMASSKFVLCPRGCGLSSYRLFESMCLGVAPVILSDDWKPVSGVDWSFALFVPERQIAKIDGIVRQHAGEWEQRGKAAREAYQRFFARDVLAQTIYDRLAMVRKSYHPGRENVAGFLAGARARRRQLGWDLYKKVKYLVLQASHSTGIPVPVQLNRPIEVQLKTAKK